MGPNHTKKKWNSNIWNSNVWDGMFSNNFDWANILGDILDFRFSRLLWSPL